MRVCTDYCGNRALHPRAHAQALKRELPQMTKRRLKEVTGPTFLGEWCDFLWKSWRVWTGGGWHCMRGWTPLWDCRAAKCGGCPAGGGVGSMPKTVLIHMNSKPPCGRVLPTGSHHSVRNLRSATLAAATFPWPAVASLASA